VGVSVGLVIFVIVIATFSNLNLLVIPYLFLDLFTVVMELYLSYQVSMIRMKRQQEEGQSSWFLKIFLEAGWSMVATAVLALFVLIMHTFGLDSTYYFYQLSLSLRAAFLQVYNESLASYLKPRPDIKKVPMPMLMANGRVESDHKLADTIQLKSTIK
jgi:cobalamin synthase